MTVMKLPCSVAFLLLLAVLADCDSGQPYRRIPFSGSIYGKRTAKTIAMGM
jgi:hypothetical protein